MCQGEEAVIQSHHYYLEVTIAEHVCGGFVNEEFYDSLDDAAVH
jgi:hypothetical protein